MGSPQTGFLILVTLMVLINLIGAWKIIQERNSNEQNSVYLGWKVTASHAILLCAQWLYIGLYVVFIEPENIEAAGHLALALLFFIPTLLAIATSFIRRWLSKNE